MAAWAASSIVIANSRIASPARSTSCIPLSAPLLPSSVTNTAVMVTEEGSKGADSGMQLVERAGEAIRELAMTIEEAAQAAIQIAGSTHQQTNGMDQLASAMSSIKQATAQTAASTAYGQSTCKKYSL